MTLTFNSLSRNPTGRLERQAGPFDTGARGVSPKPLKSFPSLNAGLLTPRVQGRGGFPEVSGALKETRSRASRGLGLNGADALFKRWARFSVRALGEPRLQPQGCTSLGKGFFPEPSGRSGVGSIRAHGSTSFPSTKGFIEFEWGGRSIQAVGEVLRSGARRISSPAARLREFGLGFRPRVQWEKRGWFDSGARIDPASIHKRVSKFGWGGRSIQIGGAPRSGARGVSPLEFEPGSRQAQWMERGRFDSGARIGLVPTA